MRKTGLGLYSLMACYQILLMNYIWKECSKNDNNLFLNVILFLWQKVARLQVDRGVLVFSIY